MFSVAVMCADADPATMTKLFRPADFMEQVMTVGVLFLRSHVVLAMCGRRSHLAQTALCSRLLAAAARTALCIKLLADAPLRPGRLDARGRWLTLRKIRWLDAAGC